ncbi:hypothetical protein ABFZ85_14855 [Hyphococcus formosus]|uniref:hypothetical protein n=1 Tax=Hyphococcus formosus TaxID=3143534 RepID=UPI00398B96D8
MKNLQQRKAKNKSFLNIKFERQTFAESGRHSVMHRHSFACLVCILVFSTFVGLGHATEAKGKTNFTVRKLSTVDVSFFWHAFYDVESISNGSVEAKYWVFNPVFEPAYKGKEYPVALIVVGGNSVRSLPTAFYVSSNRLSTVMRASNRPDNRDDAQTLFEFKFKVYNCKNCELSGVTILHDERTFDLRTENVKYLRGN